MHRYISAFRGLSAPSWFLALVMFINRVGAMVVPFLGIYMTDHLDFSLKQTGLVLSCFGLGALSGSVIGGKLTDIKGHFQVQFASLVLAAPLFFVLPQLTTPLSLSIGVFVLSLVSETFRPANSVSIAHYAKPQNITRALSLNRMALNLGFSIGPAMGGLLAAISYNLLFYGNGFTVLAAGLIFYGYFRNRKGHGAAAARPVDSGRDQGVALSPYKDMPYLLFSVLIAVYCVCFYQLLSTLPIYYKQVYMLSDAQVGLLLAFNGGVVFLLEMLLVDISERHLSSMQTIVLGCVLVALTFLILLLGAGQGIWVLYLSMFVLSISEILAMPFMASVALLRASRKTQGAYMGLNGLAFSSAHIFSPYLGTQTVAHFDFNTLWYLLTVLGLLSALGMWGLKRYL